MKKQNLPLSPHLQIYKPQITSILSISHRITGFCLNFLINLLVLWVLYNSSRRDLLLFFFISNAFIVKINNFILGIFGLTYHALNGIRHIFWDFGFFLDNISSSIFGLIIVLIAISFSVFLIINLWIVLMKINYSVNWVLQKVFAIIFLILFVYLQFILLRYFFK